MLRFRERKLPPVYIVGVTAENCPAGDFVSAELHDPFRFAVAFERVRAAVPSGHGAALAGDRALVIEILDAMIRQRLAVHLAPISGG